MKFDRIVEELSKEYEIEMIRSYDCAEIQDVALLDSSIIEFNRHTLYFGYYRQIDELKSIPELCILAVMEEERGRKDLRCPDEMMGVSIISAGALFSAFNKAKMAIDSDRGDGLYRDMVAIADETKSIEAVLNAAAAQFGNALVFSDIGFKIIASSTSIEVIDPLWVENIRKGFCSYEFIQQVRALESVKIGAQTNEPMEVTCPESPYRKLSSLVFHQNVKVGFVLVIEQNTPFLPIHRDMLRMLSQALTYTMERYYPGYLEGPSAYQQLLDDFFKGVPTSELLPRIRNMQFPNRMATILVRPTQYLGHAYLKGHLSEELRNLLPKTHLTYQKNSIIAVIPLEDSIEFTSETMSRLEKFADKHELRIGISNSFTSIESITTRFQQAVQALELGLKFHPEEKVFRYLDYQIFAMFSEMDSEAHLGKYCHPALSLLRQYDQKNNSQLYQTLRVYLEANCSIKEAAARLYIHRNSFVYRLGRITELCQLDLENAQTKLLLQLSYLIDEFNGLGSEA